VNTRKWLATLLLLATLTATSGCWDYNDLEERAFVVMLGIDRQEGEFVTSIQVSLPILAQTGNGQAGTPGGGVPEFRVMNARGRSIREALTRLNALTDRELDFGQLIVIVIGAELAREGLHHLDWLIRTTRIPLTSFLAVSRSTAAGVLEARTPAESTPSLYFFRGFKGTFTRAPEILPITLWEALLQRLNNSYEDVYIPAVTSSNYGINFAGTALFQQEHLVGWLDSGQTALLHTVMKEKLSGKLSSADPKFGLTETIISRGGVSYGTRFQGTELTLVIDATFFVDVVEQPKELLISPDSVSHMERVLAQTAQRDLEQLLATLQRSKTDPLGYGERLRRQKPSHPTLGDVNRWREAYSEASRDVEVRVRIRTRGEHQ
jgi:spore germination protein KC